MAVVESLGFWAEWVVASGPDRGGCAEVESPNSFIVRRGRKKGRTS